MKSECIYYMHLWLNLISVSARLYYQGDPARLSACPTTIHALLHITESIHFSGPVWCYWAFPMERFCGHISRAIHSKRYPWAEIDNYVKYRAQLQIITLKYELGDQLNFGKIRSSSSSETSLRIEGCTSVLSLFQSLTNEYWYAAQTPMRFSCRRMFY